MGDWIEFGSSDGHRLAGWLAEPVAAPRGGIVVIQEIFGVNEHIRRVTGGFAEAGYMALAPALMDRQQRGVELGYDEAGIAQGREIIAAVGFDNALRDVAAAADALRRRLREAGVSDQIGAVGYCWGGTVALLANTRLKLPAVSYYGGRSMPFLHERAGAALMFHFGARDPIIPPEHVAGIRTAHPQAESFVYAAGHGFNCDARADYDAAAAAEARQRTLAFFAREVG